MNSSICPWKIWGSKDKRVKTFKISTINQMHMCSKTLRSRQLTSKWIATRFYTRIKNNPSWKLEEMKTEIMKTYQLDVSLASCSKARRKALQVVATSMTEHYSKIWDYRYELMKTNEGRTIEVYCVRNNPTYGRVFQRFYVCIDALKRGLLAGCKKVLGLDRCFLKGVMKGELLIAVGRDDNNQMFPVAWGIVQVENKRA